LCKIEEPGILGVGIGSHIRITMAHNKIIHDKIKSVKPICELLQERMRQAVRVTLTTILEEVEALSQRGNPSKPELRAID
jgi:hypothetical protein